MTKFLDHLITVNYLNKDQILNINENRIFIIDNSIITVDNGELVEFFIVHKTDYAVKNANQNKLIIWLESGIKENYIKKFVFPTDSGEIVENITSPYLNYNLKNSLKKKNNFTIQFK